MKIVKVFSDMVDFNAVLDCKIDREINEHGLAMIKGWIDEEQDILKHISDITISNIYGETEDGKIIALFSGIVDNVIQRMSNGGLECVITLVGMTKLMDMDINTTSYQNLKLTYYQIIEKICKKYKAVFNDNVSLLQPVNDFIQQYKETDWKFLQRILSYKKAYIVPLFTSNQIFFDIGIDKKIQILKPDLIDYSMEKAMYTLNDENEREKMQYVLKFHSRDFFELGDRIETLDGSLMYIVRSTSRYEGAELVNFYELNFFEDIRTERKTNKRIIGASMNARVMDVRKDKVKVDILASDKGDNEITKWFPYSSIYSSPDGTGWYCMPEVGDEVRVYFPSEEETDAYVISAVHKDTSSQLRNNPDNKILVNRYMKQIEFTPTTLKMSNGNGMSILIDDDEGILIESDKSIRFIASERFEMLSLTDKVEIAADRQVSLKQNNTSINLNDDITVSGSQMFVQ